MAPALSVVHRFSPGLILRALTISGSPFRCVLVSPDAPNVNSLRMSIEHTSQSKWVWTRNERVILRWTKGAEGTGHFDPGKVWAKA